MLRLWRRNVWTVKKVSGDTRIWTMDLSDCSRLLYHWAISPRGDKVFRRERQVAMMSWFQSHLAAKKSYGAVRLKVLQYSDLPVSVGGIMVSIAAFQAVDPGSIPGRRICLHFFPPHYRPGRWAWSPFDGQLPWLGIFSLSTNMGTLGPCCVDGRTPPQGSCLRLWQFLVEFSS